MFKTIITLCIGLSFVGISVRAADTLESESAKAGQTFDLAIENQESMSKTAVNAGVGFAPQSSARGLDLAKLASTEPKSPSGIDSTGDWEKPLPKPSNPATKIVGGLLGVVGGVIGAIVGLAVGIIAWPPVLLMEGPEAAAYPIEISILAAKKSYDNIYSSIVSE